MQDEELKKIIGEFVRQCQEKNFQGVAAIGTTNGQNVKVGISTNYMDAINLLRGVLEHLQEVSGLSSTFLATHLAMSMAILDIDKKQKDLPQNFSSKTVEQAATAVKKIVDYQVEKYRLEEARHLYTFSTILQ